jgi:hypothetical protein
MQATSEVSGIFSLAWQKRGRRTFCDSRSAGVSSFRVSEVSDMSGLPWSGGPTRKLHWLDRRLHRTAPELHSHQTLNGGLPTSPLPMAAHPPWSPAGSPAPCNLTAASLFRMTKLRRASLSPSLPYRPRSGARPVSCDGSPASSAPAHVVEWDSMRSRLGRAAPDDRGLARPAGL